MTELASDTSGLPPHADSTATHVAALLPPTAPVPEEPRRVPFFRAVALHWLMPKRYGPHLAAGTFRRAFAAHLLAVLLAGVPMFLAILWQEFAERLHVNPGDPLPTDLHELRLVLAGMVLQLAAFSSPSGWDWLAPLLYVTGLPVLEVALLLLATIAMPFAAGGDRTSSVWKRSLKNVFWCTTIIIPVSIAYFALILCGVRPSELSLSADADLPYIFIVNAGILVFAALFDRAVIVGAHRYVGTPDGPAFSPREPRCDRCGYLIIGLPLETRCPECGLPVADSLPGGQRRDTPWQQHQYKPRGFLELVRMQWQVLRGVDVFRCIPVHRDIRAARHFWWATWVLITFALLAILRALLVCLPDDGYLDVWMGPVAIWLAILPLFLQFAVMFAGCLWAQWRYGIRDYRVSAIVCYYAAPLLWPCMMILLVPLVLAAGSFLQPLASIKLLKIAGVKLTAKLLVIDGLLLLAMGAVGFWFRRLLLALQAVRFANV